MQPLTNAVPAPLVAPRSLLLKQKAWNSSLTQFAEAEQVTLHSLRFRQPFGVDEMGLLARFHQVLAREVRRLQDLEEWTVPDLLGVLNRAQRQALATAARNGSWDRRRAERVLRQGVRIVLPRRNLEMMGEKLRDDSPLSDWMAWQRLDEECAGPAA